MRESPRAAWSLPVHRHVRGIPWLLCPDTPPQRVSSRLVSWTVAAASGHLRCPSLFLLKPTLCHAAGMAWTLCAGWTSSRTSPAGTVGQGLALWVPGGPWVLIRACLPPCSILMKTDVCVRCPLAGRECPPKLSRARPHPGTSECDCIWRQGPHRGHRVQIRSCGWVLL